MKTLVFYLLYVAFCSNVQTRQQRQTGVPGKACLPRRAAVMFWPALFVHSFSSTTRELLPSPAGTTASFNGTCICILHSSYNQYIYGLTAAPGIGVMKISAHDDAESTLFFQTFACARPKLAQHFYAVACFDRRRCG